MITAWLKELSGFSRTDSDREGVTRLPFSKEQKEAAQFIRKSMEQAGMQVYVDACGTVCGTYQGQLEETIIICSHYDSVLGAGIYDGCAGVAVGIEVVRQFHEKQITPPYSIAVVATNDEEGILFTKGFLSAKTICGEYGSSDYETMKVRDTNQTVSELMARNEASDLEQISLSTVLGHATCYLEPHVEQGPVLDEKKLSLGVVDQIVWLYHCHVTVTGESNHAGTTPMNLRKDPVPVMGEILAAIPGIAAEIPGAVATVGKILVSPGAQNVIAETAAFSVDMRAQEQEAVLHMQEQLRALAEAESKRHCNLKIRISNEDLVSGTPMNPVMQQQLEASIQKLRIPYMHISSGAGHDAQIFAKHMPSAMLFMPSQGGYSHSKREFTDEVHLQNAANVVMDFCMNAKLVFEV